MTKTGQTVLLPIPPYLEICVARDNSIYVIGKLEHVQLYAAEVSRLNRQGFEEAMAEALKIQALYDQRESQMATVAVRTR